MKKIILFILISSIKLGLLAQLAKGNWAITGTIGLGGNKQTTTQEIAQGNQTLPFNTEVKTSQMTILPAASYFLSDNMEAGIALLINKSKNVTNYLSPNSNLHDVKKENPLTGLALFGNYYFKSAEKYSCYVGAQLGFGGGTSKVTTTPNNGPTTIVETKNSGSTFGFNTGFLYFVKPNFALNGSLGLLSFNSTKAVSTNNGVTTTTKNGSWAFGVNGVLINIGVKLFLVKKS